MKKILIISIIFSIISTSISGQDNFTNLSFKFGFGGAGIHFSEYDEYSSDLSLLAGVSKNWPIGGSGVWFFNSEATFNYASAFLSNENTLINYNILLPMGFKFNKNQKYSFCIGLVPTFTFASQIKIDGDLYNLPDYQTNDQGVFYKSEFITTPFNVQFRIGVDFVLNKTLLFGAEFMKYFGGRTYFNKTYNSYESYELNYGTLNFCLTKRLP